MQPRAATRVEKAPKRRAAEMLAAAAKVFARRGYHGASTQDIADVLGIRQASLYYYFASKEAALEAVCADGIADYELRARRIHRSKDSGGTWTKVSSVNPQTRIPVLFRGVHYLGGTNGLVISSDLGASWQAQGAAVNIWQGPFFGRDEKEMLVVGKDGAFITRNAGEAWKQVASLKPKERGFVFTPNWFGCYAWDPVNNILYASAMGNPVYRMEL